MATVGTQLTSPESGWRRYDDCHPDIKYTSGFIYLYESSGKYNGTVHYLKSNSDLESNKAQSIEFYFYSNCIRIIGEIYKEYSANLSIEIDGELFSFSSKNTTDVLQALLFDKSDLEMRIHKAVIKSSDGYRYQLDAIDIAETGYICDSETRYDITPVMTSNSSPSPYSATASSQYNSGYAAYNAFAGTNQIPSAWITPNGTTNGWIAIDMGSNVCIDQIGLMSRNISSNIPSNSILCLPKDFTISGSLDGVTFTDIASFTDQTNYTFYSYTYFKIPLSRYRYYKLTVSSINGGVFLAIGSIQLSISKNASFFLVKNGDKYFNINNAGEFVEELDITKLSVFPPNNECIVDTSSMVDYIKTNNLTNIVSNSSIIDISGELNENLVMVVFKNDFYMRFVKVINTISSIYVNDSTKFVVSIDGGSTWKTYSNSKWSELNCIIPIKEYNSMNATEKANWIAAKTTINTSGISITELNTIPFSELDIVKIKFAIVMSYDSTNISSVTSLNYNVDEEDSLIELGETEVAKTIIGNTFSIKSIEAVDKLYINVNTVGVTPVSNIDSFITNSDTYKDLLSRVIALENK